MADQAIETAPLDSLHGVIAESARLPHIKDGYDVGVMEGCRRACLVKKPAAGGGVRSRMTSQDLQGHRTVQADVDGLVDGPHTSATQFADHAITGDPPAGLEITTGRGSGARAGPGCLTDQPVDKLQPFDGGYDVFSEIGELGGELLRLRRGALLDEGKISLDSLAETLVVLA
jgi:hypothetical protein